MFFLLRILLIIVFGFGIARTIERNPVGAWIMAIISAGLFVWLVYDVVESPQYYRAMIQSFFSMLRQ